MFLGLSTFTWIHTILSVVALVSGIIVLGGILGSQRLAGWTAVYFVTAVATSATGFGFPFDHLGPSQIVGIISLVVLALAILARYVLGLAGIWRWLYVLGTAISVYLLVFVAIAQAFAKVPSLVGLAPTQSEPPFAGAELSALVLFVLLIITAAAKFHPAPKG